MRSNKNYFQSMFMSGAIHVAILIGAAYMWIGGFAPVKHKSEELLHVKMVNRSMPIERILVPRAGTHGPLKTVPGFGGEASSVAVPGQEDVSAKVPQKREDLGGLVTQGKVENKFELPKEVVAANPQEMPQARAVESSITAPGRQVIPIAPLENAAVSPESGYLPEEFVKEMPGFTPMAPQLAGSGVGAYKPFHKPGIAASGGGGGGGPSIEEYLVADLAVYKDPSDGQKYFKITIMAGKNADKLKVLAKEIIFLIDCSLSINPDRMAEFKKGFSYCLDNLNKEDTFNVISFSETTQTLSQRPLVNTDLTVERAKKFISQLYTASSTDVYRAFADVVKSPPEHRPSYILFVSDGRPTIGVQDSREIIADINKINGDTRSIFSFSGGARTNRYLLDFIAYSNRGWSEYADRTFQISKGLSDLYLKIKDPILYNLRYRFSGISVDQIYPKTLPDLYRGAALTLFGRYGSEDVFSMQLSGDTDKVTLEPIFTDSFSNARQGTKEIARSWAFNKVYYLINELTQKRNDAALIKQIQEICIKFDIKTPYTEGIK